MYVGKMYFYYKEQTFSNTLKQLEAVPRTGSWGRETKTLDAFNVIDLWIIPWERFSQNINKA